MKKKNQRLSRRFLRKALYYIFKFFTLSCGTLRYACRKDFKEPCIIAIWHGDILPMLYYFKDKNAMSLASSKMMGAVLGDLCTDLGLHMFEGASGKGGKEAMIQMAAKLNTSNRKLVLTVDGSTGPRHKMKPGAVILAQKTGLPFYLAKAHCKGKRLPTWDRFLVPLMFEDAEIRVSGPYYVNPGLSREETEKAILKFEELLKIL